MDIDLAFQFLLRLLYQIISKRTIEIHNVKAANAPELASFINDMEFNITAVSSMSCSNLRGIGTLVTGDPGFPGFRFDSLSNFVGYSCHNTSAGPTITLKCSNCRLRHDYMYISWLFVDLPDNPATAVGFHFNFTAKDHANKKHTSFVGGTLKNGSVLSDRPVTFRGLGANVLKFSLFPRIYHNFNDLRLIQPLFHEFVPGSHYADDAQLQASLESSTDGLINTTLFVNYLSSYIVEIDNQNIMGPVSFLADLGGLYCISIGIFFYLLVQCEYRIKKLRIEDSVLRKIRNRRKAQEHWAKLRKYVMYTWGCSIVDDEFNHAKKESGCSNLTRPSIRGNGSSHGSVSMRKRRQTNRMDTISFNKKFSLPSEKSATQDYTHTHEVKSSKVDAAINLERLSNLRGEPPTESEVRGSKDDGNKSCVGSCDRPPLPQDFSGRDDNIFPFPPPLEFKAGSEVEMSEIQKNFQHLYDYNMMLRENFLALQSFLHTLPMKSSKEAESSP